MAVEVRFMTLTGKFAIAKTEVFADHGAARKAIEDYAFSHGYVKVKLADSQWEDIEGDELRFTATTPNGRAGRNVAYAADIENDA